MALNTVAQRVREIRRLARLHGLSRLRVFGSQGRGEAHPSSDLDLLVDLLPGRDLLDLAGFKLDLEEVLGLQGGCRHREESESLPARAHLGGGTSIVKDAAVFLQTALRNVLIHEHFGVDLEIVWRVVERRLPALKHHVELMFKKSARGR
jgi:predicted nucleotidyltransferase